MGTKFLPEYKDDFDKKILDVWELRKDPNYTPLLINNITK